MRFDAGSLVPLTIVAAVALVARLPLGRRKPLLAAIGRPAVFIAIAAAVTAAFWVFEGRLEPLGLLFALFLALAFRGSVPGPELPALTRALESRSAPLLAAAATCALALWVWGGLSPVPIVQDEAAYLFQSRLFALGHWADPAPPLPEFFEQMHVLVEPRRAAKYPPGHAFLLAPAAAMGAPALAPLLLAGATGGLLYALARRVAGASAASLACLVWMASPLGLRYRSSFFSEVTTGFLWLAAWAAVDRWRRGGRAGWLVLGAAAVGFGAITRPLTMLLFAIPFSIVVVRVAARRRAWASLAAATGAGLLVLLVLPLWSALTTGDWRTSPVTLYTRQYLPFDVPGFGLRAEAPTRELPSDVQWLSRNFSNVHRTHVPGNLPRTLAARLTEFLRDGLGGGLSLLLPMALVGLFVLPRDGLLAVTTGALLIVGYLVYAHHAHWTVYYFEALAPLALSAGAGLGAVIARLPARLRLPGMTVAATSLVLLLARSAAGERETKQHQSDPFRRFERRVEALQDPKSVVFVRYAKWHNAHLSLIQNGPGIAQARVWIVYDRGEENIRLREIDPSRAAYLYEEDTGRLTSVPSARRDLRSAPEPKPASRTNPRDPPL